MFPKHRPTFEIFLNGKLQHPICLVTSISQYFTTLTKSIVSKPTNPGISSGGGHAYVVVRGAAVRHEARVGGGPRAARVHHLRRQPDARYCVQRLAVVRRVL